MVRVISPYGKDADAELREVHGVEGADDLLARLLPHVEAGYGLKIDAVEAVHVAFGLALFLAAGKRRYVYKLTSSRIHGALPDLFAWLARLHAAGAPVPMVHRAKGGAWSTAPLPGSDHDAAYLMDWAPGAPAAAWSPERAQAYADLLASVHRLGTDHQPRVMGTLATFADKWPSAPDIAAPLLASPTLPRAPVAAALRLIERTTVPPDLVRTHTHGDPRLCHVLFTGDRVTGLVDNDQGTWGDRLLDLAHGAVSHPDPARGAWLAPGQVADVVLRYDALATLTAGERRFLPAALTFAALEQLAETVAILGTGRTTVTVRDVERGAALLGGLASGSVRAG